MKKINKDLSGEKLNKRFVRIVEEAFPVDDTEDQYQEIVVRPSMEARMVENFEASFSFSN
jgi:hypothetical protein